MIDQPRVGWHPRAMACPVCDGPDPDCGTCNGTGWHPNSHVINDGLFIAEGCVATLEAFRDGGPYYANAVTPDGVFYRRGACSDHALAASWCERVAGLHPLLPGDLENAGRLG